jgi:mannose-1-phosphate guanylyltransferase|tara:strand:+ start:3836 stop:4795 length:960 start_codon:yes stop_codon:yes gene_type:complete
MDVIVLAGGFGTRLRPWTEGRAKPLLPLLDKTLLERVVEAVPFEMVDRVVVAAGYGIDEMESFLAGANLPYEIVLSVENEAMGTGGAVALARQHLSGQGPVLVLNGDLISSVDVTALVVHHAATGAKATLSLWEVEDPSRFGVCDLDESGMIGRFQEKPEPGTEFSNLINAGCYLIERDVLNGLSSDKHSMEREVFPGLAEAGGMAGLAFTGYFVDAGTPESFIEAAQVCIANGRYDSGHVEDDSWFGKGSNCIGAAHSSSIGQGCNIEEGASVSDCVILSEANIGTGARLDGCLVGQGANVAPDSNYSGLVIGHGASV